MQFGGLTAGWNAEWFAAGIVFGLGNELQSEEVRIMEILIKNAAGEQAGE